MPISFRTSISTFKSWAKASLDGLPTINVGLVCHDIKQIKIFRIRCHKYIASTFLCIDILYDMFVQKTHQDLLQY